MKQEFKIICECNKTIKGFSEKHIRKNLEIHRLISKEHRERMELIKNVKNTIIKTENFSNEMIVEMLVSHPIMIEDMKEIGRSMNKEERKNEKKILVS